jgi:hypothetical protein
MGQENERNNRFFGTYFDADAVIKIARWAALFSWVVLGIYLVIWLSTLLQALLQLFSGMYFEKGNAVLNVINIFLPYLAQPLPGLFYFFGLQAISKILLILLDMEENTRHTVKK